jgi:hypothetical protein
MEGCRAGVCLGSGVWGCFENNAVASDTQAHPSPDDIQLCTWKPRWARRGNALEAPIDRSRLARDPLLNGAAEIVAVTVLHRAKSLANVSADRKFSCDYRSAVHGHAQWLGSYRTQVPAGPASFTKVKVSQSKIPAKSCLRRLCWGILCRNDDPCKPEALNPPPPAHLWVPARDEVDGECDADDGIK